MSDSGIIILIGVILMVAGVVSGALLEEQNCKSLCAGASHEICECY